MRIKLTLLVLASILLPRVVLAATACVIDCTFETLEVTRLSRAVDAAERHILTAQVALDHATAHATAMQLRYDQKAALLLQRKNDTATRGDQQLQTFLSLPKNAACRLGCRRYDILNGRINLNNERAGNTYQNWLRTRPTVMAEAAFIISRSQTRLDIAMAEHDQAVSDFNASQSNLNQCRALPPPTSC